MDLDRSNHSSIAEVAHIYTASSMEKKTVNNLNNVSLANVYPNGEIYLKKTNKDDYNDTQNRESHL